MKTRLVYLFAFVALLLIQGCEDDVEPKPIDLIANAGQNQVTEPLKLVTLDGSESTGPEGFTYSWSYDGNVPESEIDFKDVNTANPSFVPPENDTYVFTLTISSGDMTDEDQVIITTSQPVELGGTLSADLELKNIQSDPDIPDYIVTSNLIVGDELVLSVVDENVNVEFRKGTGIHVKDGGRFTNVDTTLVNGYNLKLYNEEGWKGILVENGILFLNNAKIMNAGAEKFAGQNEAAVISFVGSETQLLNVGQNEFIGSQSYDILCLDAIAGSGYVFNNTFSYKNPMKISTRFMGFFSRDYHNYYPENHEYTIIVPGGTQVKDVPHRGIFMFPPDGNYYIDGDFWAGEQIYIRSNVNIYMKEGSAIFAEKKVLARVFPERAIEIDGLNGATWKGIASDYNEYLGFELENVTIRNAGYGIIQFDTFEADEPSALYINSQGSILNCTIENSGGYGFYNFSQETNSLNFKGVHFVNTARAAIRTNPVTVSTLLSSSHGCTFSLNENTPACLLQGEGAPINFWYPLGDDNYYLVDAVISDDSDFRIMPGTILKFKSGRSLIRADESFYISLRGTQAEPIILEGEDDSPGSWGGLYLGTYGGFEHVIIRNGGEFVLPNATEEANIVSAVPADEEIFEMVNSTISNSAGYGIVVEAGTKDFDYEDPDNNNIFENNELGDVVKK